MNVTNSKKEIYEFTQKEMIKIFMYAYGYLDISQKGYLPVYLDTDMETTNLTKKMQQCFEGEFELTEKVRKLF